MPRTVILGVVYLIVAYGSAVLDPSVPDSKRFMWRLGAWVVTGVVYAAHIVYERFHLRNSPRATALHVAYAVALGGFLLAAAATIHATMVPSHPPYARFLLALVIWPLITAVPAFVVALAATVILARFIRT